MILRDYQRRSIDMLYKWFLDGNDGNVCLVLPTGAGKSHIIATLIKEALQEWPETRVLMLCHQRELIAQNAEKLRQHWPNAPLGIYSASMGRRCLSEPITFAGIQSLARKAAELGHVDIIIVDECHTINLEEQTGTYRKVLAELTAINPAIRVIGLTASPYRLGQGMIHEGENALFSALIEPVSIEELVHRGHLSKLRSKHTTLTLDTTGVKKQGGEFVAAQLEAAVDTAANNQRAVAEIIQRGQDRKSWLVFCAGVGHAEHVNNMIQAHGIVSACVTGGTAKGERDRILSEFKAGRIRCVTNVGVLTTGFDAPGVDMIAMLRPTMSPGLYLQMAGRGLRVAEGKADCLVLDFAGNVDRHGPITAIEPPRKARKGEAEPRAKVCPSCGEKVGLTARQCPECGHEWPAPEANEKTFTLANDDIMGIEPTEMLVTGWTWRKHTSRTSGKDMIQVSYYGGLTDPVVTEYLPVMHEGYAGEKARRQVISIAVQSGANDLSDDLADMAKVMNASTPPGLLKFKRDGKFHRVIERVWHG